jgi:hypothetical protein
LQQAFGPAVADVLGVRIGPDLRYQGKGIVMTDTASIREHMPVFGSCGNRLGDVDRVEGQSIKLTRNSSSDGQHHYIPMNWVESVDDKVHLNKDCGEAKKEWKAAP